MLNAKLADEPARLSALERYAVLDTPAAEPFDRITSLVRSILQVPIAAVSLVDRERQWFKSIQGLEVRQTPRSASFCAHTILDRTVMVVPDATADPRFVDNPLVTGEPHIRSYVGAPLCTPDGYNVGALCAIDTVPRSFSEEQLGILGSFASLVVDELELRRIAETDHVTGAMSRRGFTSALDKELERYRRGNRGSVLVLLDIDHFKSINDRFGHPAGDDVLRTVSHVCMAHLRANDVFGRLGGEEFGILLTETDEEGGMAAADKIRAKIANAVMPLADGRRVTASFGVSALRAGSENAGSWLADADRALYLAKRSGRNRCVVASQLEDSEAG